MVNKAYLLVCLLLVIGSTLANGQQSEQEKGICQGKVESMLRCHWIDGSVAIYNGTPSIRIHQLRSKRVYAVGPAEQELIPSELKSKLTLNNAIDGKFRICPFVSGKQKGLRSVCVDEVKILKITDNPT
jgi:hypothetical protein